MSRKQSEKKRDRTSPIVKLPSKEPSISELSDALSLIKAHLPRLEAVSARENAKEYNIPVSIFATEDLSQFEAVSFYLQKTCNKTPADISKILGKSYMDVYLTCRNASRKLTGNLSANSPLSIPLAELISDKITLNESLILYLKDIKQLEFKTIAKLILRDRRNVWTVYQRALAKVRGGAS